MAAVTAASAAALVAMAARFSDRARRATPTGCAPGLVRLADADAAAYTAVLAARGPARKEALRRATEVPREIAAVAAEVAVLAHRLVAAGNPRLLGDARVAELLAEAAGRRPACWWRSTCPHRTD